MRFVRCATALLLAGCAASGVSSAPRAAALRVAGDLRAPSGACPTTGSGVSKPRPPLIFNEFVTVPSGSPIDYEIPICGNWATQLGTQPLYGPYNAFCPPSRGASDPCDSAVSYDPTTGVTTDGFSGSTLNQNIPGHSGEYHFGLLSTFYGESTDNFIVGPYWTYKSPLVANQATVSVNWDPNVVQRNDWKYANVYIAVALHKKGRKPRASGCRSAIARRKRRDNPSLFLRTTDRNRCTCAARASCSIKRFRRTRIVTRPTQPARKT